MKVLKTTRLKGNPRNKKRRMRNLSPKQIRIFGTKRQKAALKAKRKRKAAAKKVAVRPNRPRPRVRKMSHNPLVLHLKPLQRSNPKRRASKMAKPKRRKRSTQNRRRRRVVSVTRNRRRKSSNPHRANRRRTTANRRRRSANRRNPTRIVVMAPRRANRRNGRRGKRNPQLFGSSLGSKGSLEILGGGLAGVAAVKFIPTLIPSTLTGMLGTSSFGPFVISGIAAFVAWWLASKVSQPFGDGVLFGGLMQAVSVGLNAFLPGLSIGGVPIALSGFGDLVPGQFAVPQNPLRQRQLAAAAPAHMPAPAGAKVTTSGLGRAYPTAY